LANRSGGKVHLALAMRAGEINSGHEILSRLGEWVLPISVLSI